MPNLQNGAQTLTVFGDVARVYDCSHFQGINLSQPLGFGFASPGSGTQKDCVHSSEARLGLALFPGVCGLS